MAGYRIDRLNEDVKRELSDIIRELKDPRLTGLVSVIRAEVSSDLSYAKVYVSVVGCDSGDAMKVIKNASGHIRHELASRLSIRKTPELKFILDDSIEHGARIATLLNKIEKGE
jgi:ribosome-binding factor A